ncbi:MAG: DUF3685 domain-containing protein, partial [Leptolyngbyaceae cyanobacterium bins.59]|nr:DUF3685 domain-containing protein [Leptolyngbyaceae cyanobacterium bins.59]
FSQVNRDQVMEKQSLLLQDLWQAATTDLFGKYYTLEIREGRSIEIVEALLQDRDAVQREILDKIPLAGELLCHLLFETPLTIDQMTVAAGSPEAMGRAEMLLNHLLLQVGNAVLQPLLNHFADLETIKRNFYNRRLLSTREIERFRNQLSWKYRLERSFQEPKAIFESQYPLFVLTEFGIRQTAIYAHRRAELDQLSGVPLVVTLLLEARDAVAPRVRSAVSFVGSGLIYVLTEVVGRGIGLIGRGILQGLGNVGTRR